MPQRREKRKDIMRCGVYIYKTLIVLSFLHPHPTISIRTEWSTHPTATDHLTTIEHAATYKPNTAFSQAPTKATQPSVRRVNRLWTHLFMHTLLDDIQQDVLDPPPNIHYRWSEWQWVRWWGMIRCNQFVPVNIYGAGCRSVTRRLIQKSGRFTQNSE